MKGLRRIGALLIILAILVGAFPVSAARSEMKYLTTVGGGINPHFANGRVTGGAHRVFYGLPEQNADVPTYTDETAVADYLRQGIKERRQRITFVYKLGFALPETQIAFDTAVETILSDIFEGALVETDDATEGDYLRFAYYSRQYGAGARIYPDRSELEVEFIFDYLTTVAQEAELTETMTELVDSFGFDAETDELERIQTVYDYITANVTYDYENLEDESYKLKYSAYAALMHGTSVCEGYALLFYRMARMCGLRTRVIAGCGGEGRDVNHGWNIVALGNTYYYVDATWDAGMSEYSYFLKGDNDFPGHTNEEKYNTPEFRALYPIAETGYVFDTDPDEVRICGYYQYTVSGGQATIVGYTGDEEHVVVPAEVDGVPVVYVQGAFSNNHTVKTITYSEGIVGNAIGTINYCRNLTAVHYPSTMRLSASAEYGFTDAPINCEKLATVTVAAGNPNLRVEGGVLYSKDLDKLIFFPTGNGIKKFVVPEGVTLIAPEAFADHVTLEEVVFPSTLKKIASLAFATATKLVTADIPEGCESIGQYVFSYTAVKKIHIPASLKQIRLFALDLCYPTEITVHPNNPYYRVTNGLLHSGTNAYRVEVDREGAFALPDGITYLENGAFLGAEKLTSISLPSSLKEIGNHAFEGCVSLTHLTLPDGVEIIGDLAFSSCDKLVSIIIPDSVEVFKDYLFHPYNHVTIYGGAVAQQIAQTVPANYYPLSQFACVSGHDLQEVVTVDDNFERKYYFACALCGGKTKEYHHIYPNLSKAEAKIEFVEATYTGENIIPKVQSVVYEDKTLVENVDYKVNYPLTAVTVGSYGVGINGIGKYRGMIYLVYQIKQADISEFVIEMPQTEFVYEGKPVQPEFTVYWKGKEMVRYEDYGFTYENNNAEGIAALVVTGNQNFSGEKRVPFVIGEHEHRYEPTQIDENTHEGICACGRKTAPEAHRFDDNCDSYCNDCYYYRVPEHEWADVWNGDDNNHYISCIRCGSVTSFGAHSGGNATCSNAKVCDVCNRAYGNTLAHEWDMTRWETEPSYHYRPCKHCSAGEYHAPHTGGRATCTSMGKCVDCGYEYLNTVDHKWGTWTKSERGHERFCIDCQTSAGMQPHNMVGSRCSECGYEQQITPPPASNPFTDVKKKDYFYAPVLWAVENGVTAGLSPDSFGPQEYCTRAQVVTFLWRAAGSPAPRGLANPFVDVSKKQYYYKAVLWAVEQGITAGADATHFAPDATCTRGQIVAFLYRFAGQPTVNGSNPFADVTKKQYYYKAVLWAVGSGITAGVDPKHFAPEDICTRAQVVSFLYRFMG